MRTILLTICGIIFLSSCNEFDPEEYRKTIEDCFRYEISMRSSMKRIEENEFMISNLRLKCKMPYDISDYKHVVNLISQAKETHHCSTYYETLVWLRTYISDYESSVRQIKLYRNIVNNMIVGYNNVELALSPFEKISFGVYEIKDEISGSTCTIEKRKDHVDLNVTINEENL